MKWVVLICVHLSLTGKEIDYQYFTAEWGRGEVDSTKQREAETDALAAGHVATVC